MHHLFCNRNGMYFMCSSQKSCWKLYRVSLERNVVFCDKFTIILRFHWKLVYLYARVPFLFKIIGMYIAAQTISACCSLRTTSVHYQTLSCTKACQKLVYFISDATIVSYSNSHHVPSKGNENIVSIPVTKQNINRHKHNSNKAAFEWLLKAPCWWSSSSTLKNMTQHQSMTNSI